MMTFYTYAGIYAVMAVLAYLSADQMRLSVRDGDPLLRRMQDMNFHLAYTAFALACGLLWPLYFTGVAFLKLAGWSKRRAERRKPK
jgi:hypothetical protein